MHSGTNSVDQAYGTIGIDGIRVNTGETPVAVPGDDKNVNQNEDKTGMDKSNHTDKDKEYSANSTPTIQVKKRLSSTSNFASMLSNIVALSTKDTKEEDINQTERKGSSTNLFGGMDLFQNRRNRAGGAGKRTARPHSAGHHGDGSQTPGTPTSGTPTNVKGNMTPTRQGINIGRKARNHNNNAVNRNLSDTNLIRTSETMQVYGSDTNLNSHMNSIDDNDDAVAKRPASSTDILQDAHHHRNVNRAIAALEAENDMDSDDEDIVIPNKGGSRRSSKN